MEQQNLITLLLKELTANPAFDPQDKAVVQYLLQHLEYWSQDLHAVRQTCQQLELIIPTLTGKYARLARETERMHRLIRSQLKVEAQRWVDQQKIKPKTDAVEAHYRQDPKYIQSRQTRDSAQTLSEMFDKLAWAIVRKHERTRDQSKEVS